MVMIAVVMVVFKTEKLSNRIMPVLVMTVPVVVAVIMTMVDTTVRTAAIHENAAQRKLPQEYTPTSGDSRQLSGQVNGKTTHSEPAFKNFSLLGR